jgi:hypothetical protein
MAAGSARLQRTLVLWTGLVPALLSAAPISAYAACPMELSVYGDRDDAAWIDFRPTGESAVVTNSFKMVLEKGVVLDGIVMWSEGVKRPYASLMYQCPEGDVTGEEIAACTLWEGVIYAADTNGKVDLIPAEGEAAPPALIFPDLGPTLRMSAAYGEDGFSKLPWDVFALKGCQE